MKTDIACLLLFLWLGAGPAWAGTAHIEHVIVIVQENRTPDNLFYSLCTEQILCSTNPDATQYDIKTTDWLNKYSPTGVTQPVPVALANDYDLRHRHPSFVAMCDRDPATSACLMDGAADIECVGGKKCPPDPQFAFVDNSTGILDPYLALAKQYGWANYMFQTNQGPSSPAHQFLFGGSSAPNKADDHAGIFASENNALKDDTGCIASPGTTMQLIDANGAQDPTRTVFPCFHRKTVSDILASHGFTWRYYTSLANSIWTAPDAIGHICEARGQQCTGAEWNANVDLLSSDVLNDIMECKLRNVSWVIPTGQNSDHAKGNAGGGPSWVASIVNAVGNSRCRDKSGTYWNDTAIFITWDDWGGWYDHEPPTFLAYPEGGYQYGFRVPFLVVSAYTPQGYIDNTRHDFGSLIRFIEHNFLIREGALTFADARATTDLLNFFNFNRSARAFRTVPAPLDARHFLNDKSPPLPPDDD